MDSDVENETDTHRRILDAVETSGPAIATAVVHEHITQAGELLVDQFSPAGGNGIHWSMRHAGSSKGALGSTSIGHRGNA